MEIELNDANFEQEVLKSELPVLVDFWAPWCGPCSMVAPVVEEISREYEDNLKVCRLNVDEARKTASKYSIMSIPTLAIFKNGKTVETIVGAVAPARWNIFICIPWGKPYLEEKIRPHIE